jgi:hypothetical protein
MCSKMKNNSYRAPHGVYTPHMCIRSTGSGCPAFRALEAASNTNLTPPLQVHRSRLGCDGIVWTARSGGARSGSSSARARVESTWPATTSASRYAARSTIPSHLIGDITPRAVVAEVADKRVCGTPEWPSWKRSRWAPSVLGADEDLGDDKIDLRGGRGCVGAAERTGVKAASAGAQGCLLRSSLLNKVGICEGRWWTTGGQRSTCDEIVGRVGGGSGHKRVMESTREHDVEFGGEVLGAGL